MTTWAEAAQEIHDDWAARGLLHTPPDATGSDPDLLFWREVRRRAEGGRMDESAYTERLHPRNRLGEWVGKLLPKHLADLVNDYGFTRSHSRFAYHVKEVQKDYHGERAILLVEPHNIEGLGRTKTYFTDENGKHFDNRDEVLYDPKLAEIESPEGRMVQSSVNLKPDSGWLADSPMGEEGEPGYIYRGVSHEEMQFVREHGYIESHGSHNIGDIQKDTTSFGTDPAIARSYASGFAPWYYKPTFDQPSYILKVRDEGLDHVDLSSVMGSDSNERSVRGRIPVANIEQVVEVRPYAMRTGQTDVADPSVYGEYGGDPGGLMIGGRGAPTTYDAYRDVTDEALPQQITQRVEFPEGSPLHGVAYNATSGGMWGGELRMRALEGLRTAIEDYPIIRNPKPPRGGGLSRVVRTADPDDPAWIALATPAAQTRMQVTYMNGPAGPFTVFVINDRWPDPWRDPINNASQIDGGVRFLSLPVVDGPEGMAWHEAGHAVMFAHDEGAVEFDPDVRESWYKQLLADHGITIEDALSISDYAVSSPSEGFAELFATYNYMPETMTPELREKSRVLFDKFKPGGEFT